jgi:hypothetical protein
MNYSSFPKKEGLIFIFEALSDRKRENKEKQVTNKVLGDRKREKREKQVTNKVSW